MKVNSSKTSELTREQIGQLYDLCYSNLSPKMIKSNHYSELSTPEYKEKWIDEIKNKENAVYLEFFDDSNFVGFTIIYLNPDENFVREFQIIKEYQDDGKSFKEMVRLALPSTNKNNIYTGIIFDDNNGAKNAFRSLGVGMRGGKYQVTYDMLVKMLDRQVNMK